MGAWGERRRGRGLSLTDLHKGTHNCAAAIRESGAGISLSSSSSSSAPAAASPQPARSTPALVVHPRPPSSPLSSSLFSLFVLLASSGNRRGGGGEKGRWCPGTQSVPLLSFFHTSGRRCRWFPAWYYGALLLYFLSTHTTHIHIHTLAILLFPFPLRPFHPRFCPVSCFCSLLDFPSRASFPRVSRIRSKE